MNYSQRLRARKKASANAASRLPSLQAIACAVWENPPKNRYKEEPMFRLKAIARSRVTTAFKSGGFKKSGSTAKMLGCSFDELKRHIEKQFTRGMNWSNHGEWHIDHRIPVASASTVKELEYLLHYLNLQPLWAGVNLDKSDSMPESVQLHLPIRNHHKT